MSSTTLYFGLIQSPLDFLMEFIIIQWFQILSVTIARLFGRPIATLFSKVVLVFQETDFPAPKPREHWKFSGTWLEGVKSHLQKKIQTLTELWRKRVKYDERSREHYRSRARWECEDWWQHRFFHSCVTTSKRIATIGFEICEGPRYGRRCSSGSFY